MKPKRTERANKVLALAEEEAAAMGATTVTTAHLLLGILREGEGVAMAVLMNLADSLREDCPDNDDCQPWVTLEKAREMTARLFGLTVAPSPPTPTGEAVP